MKRTAKSFLDVVQPHYLNSPPYEKLVAGLSGACSQRIDIQHHLVYQAQSEEQAVNALRLWSYYE